MKKAFDTVAMMATIWSWIALKVWIVPIVTVGYYVLCGALRLLEYLDSRKSRKAGRPEDKWGDT